VTAKVSKETSFIFVNGQHVTSVYLDGIEKEMAAGLIKDICLSHDLRITDAECYEMAEFFTNNLRVKER